MIYYINIFFMLHASLLCLGSYTNNLKIIWISYLFLLIIFVWSAIKSIRINYNLIFLLGLILSIYDTTFYLKGIDTETGAKNSITDLIIGAFTLVASIILIIGLSDKIYI